MKKILIILAAFIMVLFTACGAPPQQSEPPSPSVSVSPSITPAPSPSVSVSVSAATPSPSVSAMPENVSFTTGLPLPGAQFKPVGVMIENSEAARPQDGLQDADIVYEALAEGAITRFFCLFNDNLPEKAGPVRSLRLYYMHMQKEWDSILVHYGGPSTSKYESNVYGPSSNYIKIRVDMKGLFMKGVSKGSAGKYFWRVGSGGVHDVRTNVKEIQQLYNYTPNPRTPWRFDAHTDYAPNDAPVSKVSLPFVSGDTFLWYTYDKQNDVLIRHMGSKEFKDAGTKKAVEVKNLIVQYVHYRSLPEIKGRRMADLTGSGNAEFIIGGKYVKGTWERKDLDSQTVYKDADGKEIVLRPGNTWIEVHPDNKNIKVEYEGA